MRQLFRIIIIVIPIIYGIYVSYFKTDVAIVFPESPIIVLGIIDDYKEERLSSNRYRIKIEEYNGAEVKETARFLLVTNPYTNYKYGQELELTGAVELPEDFITDTGKTFDYDSYLKLSNVYGIMSDPEIKIVQDFKGNYFKKILFNIREKFSNSLDNKLPQMQSSLAKGILLGEKSGITNSLRENLAKTSTSHIIALSGYNITIVSEIIIKLSQGLPIIARSLLGFFGIFIFIIMAGGGSSALRAGIMASVLLYSRSRGKKYDALYALFLATSILILITPLSLRYDMGFHLSILATFGLITYQNHILVFFIKKKLYKWLSEILASTLAASIMTMPYIAYNMGIISILGIFVNMLVVPLVPVLMLFSFLSGILPGILSIPFTSLTNLVSTIILNSINKIGSISFAAVYTDKINLVSIIILYLILFYIAFKLVKKES